MIFLKFFFLDIFFLILLFIIELLIFFWNFFKRSTLPSIWIIFHFIPLILRRRINIIFRIIHWFISMVKSKFLRWFGGLIFIQSINLRIPPIDVLLAIFNILTETLKGFPHRTSIALRLILSSCILFANKQFVSRRSKICFLIILKHYILRFNLENCAS